MYSYIKDVIVLVDKLNCLLNPSVDLDLFEPAEFADTVIYMDNIITRIKCLSAPLSICFPSL